MSLIITDMNARRAVKPKPILALRKIAKPTIQMAHTTNAGMCTIHEYIRNQKEWTCAAIKCYQKCASVCVCVYRHKMTLYGLLFEIIITFFSTLI